MKFKGKWSFTANQQKDEWLSAIERMTPQDCETMLTVLRSGINCNQIQNKPEGTKILSLINDLEQYLKGDQQ